MNRRWSATLVVALAVVASSLVQAYEAEAKPRPMCFGKRATIVGNKKANTLRGTKKADVIVGLNGNDRIIGSGGADRICGGVGKDRIYGGVGNDRLDGGGGTDECRQEAGTGPKKRCEGPRLQLAVSKAGSGSGIVTSSPSGIDCGQTCAEDFMEGLKVTLTAAGSGGSTFSGWGGPCTGTGSCAVQMSKAQLVTANFSAAAPPPPPPLPPSPSFSLNVTKSGPGLVSSSPAGISCGVDCSESYSQATVVTLTATPNASSVFTGWSGDCSGTDETCMVLMDQARSVTTTFAPGRDLTVTVFGNLGGGGTVTSNPGGINCTSGTCTKKFAEGTSVTLTAAPNASSVFTGWSGDCSGTSPTCTVTMNQDRNVSATFTIGHDLSVTFAGTGGGTVTSNPAGINCTSGPCTKKYAQGTSVTLTATPNDSSVFASWSGSGCSGTGTCVVTMDGPRNVTATFTVGYDLTATVSPSSSGTVTSNLPGINCPGDCTEKYAENSSVTLTASPNLGWVFSPGWSGGGCSGTGTCVVTMDMAKTVTAQFTSGQTLTATKPGNGGGSVTSNLAGINCGSDCSESYLNGTQVELTASPNATSVFTGWGGDVPASCTISPAPATCTVTMNQDRNVTATFKNAFTLSVTVTGSGGAVTSDALHPGINCPGDCSEKFADTETVTLTASGGTFLGWGGDCLGELGNTCTRAMSQDRNVTANFAPG